MIVFLWYLLYPLLNVLRSLIDIKMLLYSYEEIKKDTLLLNLYTDSNISEESYLRIKNLIYNRDNVPEELVLPK